MSDTAILPTTMPTETTSEFMKSRAKFAFCQAVWMLARSWSPGSHGSGTASTCCWVSVPVTNTK